MIIMHFSRKLGIQIFVLSQQVLSGTISQTVLPKYFVSHSLVSSVTGVLLIHCSAYIVTLLHINKKNCFTSFTDSVVSLCTLMSRVSILSILLL